MVAALAFLLFVLIPSVTWGQPEQEYTDNFNLTARDHTRASSSRLEASPPSRLPCSTRGYVDALMLRTTTASSQGSVQPLGRQRQKTRLGLESACDIE